MNVYCYYAVVNLMLQGSRLQIYPEQWPLSPQSNPIRYQLFILRGCMGHSPSQECLPWSTFPSSSCSSLHLLCYFHHPLHLSMFLPPFSSIFLPISVLLMEIACCQRIITGHPENTVVCTYNDGISSSSHLSEDIDKQASVQDCIFCIVVAKLNHGTRFVFLYAVPPPCAIQIMQSGRSWQYNFNQCKKKKIIVRRSSRVLKSQQISSWHYLFGLLSFFSLGSILGNCHVKKTSSVQLYKFPWSMK